MGKDPLSICLLRSSVGHKMNLGKQEMAFGRNTLARAHLQSSLGVVSPGVRPVELGLGIHTPRRNFGCRRRRAANRARLGITHRPLHLRQF